jgi:pimeloyl-ACP methyl ester carboxylesterase
MSIGPRRGVNAGPVVLTCKLVLQVTREFAHRSPETIMSLATLLIPGLGCSARLYGEQIPMLWRHGPVTVADTARDDTMGAMARRILADAPPRFALAGLSMGGYIALEIMRQAPARVAKLALLDTSAQPERLEQTALRKERIALTKAGRFAEVLERHYPLLVHASRHDDTALKAIHDAMHDDVGPDAYLRQQQAIMGRADSRPTLAVIACPTLVLVGDSDTLTPPAHAEEMAAGIKGSRLVVVPDCGHVATLERPAEVNAALKQWIDG